MTMMTHNGYEAIVEYDDDAGIFHGEVINLRDVVTFQGNSVAALKQAFAGSVDDYLAFCEARGEERERPFSGRFVAGGTGAAQGDGLRREACGHEPRHMGDVNAGAGGGAPGRRIAPAAAAAQDPIGIPSEQGNEQGIFFFFVASASVDGD